jgi:hypothetical protein
MNHSSLRLAGAFVIGAAVTVLLQVLVIHASTTTTIITAIAVGTAATLAVGGASRRKNTSPDP